MAENVFIFGAGASADCGAPLMHNFLDVAEDLLRVGAFQKNKNKIEEVFEVIDKLQKIYSKSYLDLNNIETLFGIIEMANIIERLEDYSKEKIVRIRNALILLIVKTLEKKTTFIMKRNTIIPTQSYNRFVESIKAKGVEKCSLITFNYDLALDVALHSNLLGIDYCLENTGSNVKLLKLHGSINWARCDECNKIIPYYLDNLIRNFNDKNMKDNDTIILDVSSNLADLKHDHEHKNIEEVPVIVPPTWNKTQYHGGLSNVWKVAADELSEARNIFVIGYSLPETDSFFRYLYSLGTLGSSRIRRFWVFDPDEKNGVEERYRQLLGKGIIGRFQYFSEEFSSAIGKIKKESLDN